MALTLPVTSEITRNAEPASPEVQQEIGAMLHLVHEHLQQLHGTVGP